MLLLERKYSVYGCRGQQRTVSCWDDHVVPLLRVIVSSSLIEAVFWHH